MASSKKLQGITIEIGGNTTKLSESLKGVNKLVSNTQSELKNLNSLLKLDPSNTMLLEQKQKLLADAIKGTAEKLRQLQEAKKQADETGSVDKNSAEYRELEREIAAAQQTLKKFTDQEEETTKSLNSNSDSVDKFGKNSKEAGDNALKLGDIIKANLISDAVEVGLKKLADGMKLVASSIVDLGKQSLNSFADYQQLTGGVETLFGKSSQTIMKYASTAYKSSGLSANQYMEQITSFSASLINSLDGDTQKAAEVGNMAIQDMSDNANKMGTDIQSIQNAYQGFAKQNYTMLDNLKLGYGGTKTEMERLLKDAEKFSGVKYDIKNLNDVYEAIHVVQQEMGITGTTALEAGTTITGSLNQTKAAWENLLTGMADSSADKGQLIKDLMTSIFGDGTESNLGVLGNVVPIITEIAQSFAQFIPTIIEEIMKNLPQLVDAATSIILTIVNSLTENLPQIIEMGFKLITSLIDGVIQVLPQIAEQAISIVNTLITSVISMLPKIIETGIQILIQLAQGIVDAIPTLITTMVDVLLQLINTIIDNLPEIISTGIDILLALIDGIIDAIPMLIEALPDIIVNIVMALTDPEMLLKLVGAALQLILALGEGLIQAIPQLLMLIPTIISKFVKALRERITETDWLELGKNILKGILDGMLDFGTVVKDTIKKVGNKITKSIKDFFGIKSPSRLMKKEVGKYLAQGISTGFEDEIPNTIDEVQNAMSELNNGIQASVNPTINPTANTNPLIIQIENFNNDRQTDIQALAEELEYYRKNSSLAVGGR